MNKHTALIPHKQQGAILVIALMFLTAITLLTISSMRATNIGLYMAQNEESRITAEQAAQALADAIVANPSATPVHGMQGFTACTAGQTNCDRYDLAMTATVNGTEVSRDSLANMNWTFAQIIERASYGVELRPGDVIGSGTCGTGCFLELNGSKITDNQWLEIGDKIELSIEGLGTLENAIELEQ